MSQFFASGGQSIGASASASVLPMSIQYQYLFPPVPIVIPCKSKFYKHLKIIVKMKKNLSKKMRGTETRNQWYCHLFEYWKNHYSCRNKAILWNKFSKNFPPCFTMKLSRSGKFSHTKMDMYWYSLFRDFLENKWLQPIFMDVAHNFTSI